MRSNLTLVAGVLAALISGALLLLAAFLAMIGADARQPVLFAVISVFPLLIAIACLSAKHRTAALRLVGCITAIVMAGVLINSFVNPDVEIGRRGRGLYFAMCIGAAMLAFKGRWPSS
jgi:hypothetical protein